MEPMDTFGAPAIAFAVVAFFSLLELVTSEFPQTISFLRRSWAFYAYGFAYGALAFIATIGINKLSAANAIKLEGLGLSSPWIRAFAIGISFKALLHIRLFTVTAGGQTFPVGVETLVQLFEPWLKRRINIQHWNATQAFIGTRTKKYNDLKQVQARIVINLPTNLPETELKAFRADVLQTTSVEQAMEQYLIVSAARPLTAYFPPCRLNDFTKPGLMPLPMSFDATSNAIFRKG